MYGKVGICTLILIFCMGMTAVAKDTADPGYSLGEMLVSAPEARGAEAVGTVRRITAGDIELRQARTLDKALELLPGLDIRKGAQGIPRVNIRGLRSRHVVLLLNGIPFNSTYDGQFDPSLISTENIARIKVSYGSHSVLYGPGGLGGVINIITKKGTDGIRGGVAADIDERGDYTTRMDISGGGESLDFFVSGSRQDADGFQLSDDFDPTAQEDGGIRENSDHVRENLYANLGTAAGDALRLGLVLGGNQGEYGKPPSVIDDRSDPFYKKPKYERVNDYEGRFGQISMGYDPGGRFDLRAWGYVNQNQEDLARYDDDDYSAITDKGSFDKTDESQIYGGTIQSALDLDGFGRLAASVNGEKNTYDSSGYEMTKKGRSDINISNDIDLFSAALEYDITLFDNLGLVAGYSHHWQNKDEGNDEDKGSWLFGLSYDLFENTLLRASYARKLRFASIKNLYDADSGNPDLTTEESDNYEFGVTQRMPWGMMADLVVFRNEMDDYIEKNNTTDLYENNDEYRFKGIEIVFSKAFENAALNLGYSLLDAEDKSPGSGVDDLEYRPTHKVSVAGNYAFDFGLTAYASVVWLMDQIHYADDGTQAELGDFSLVDLKLEQRLYKQMAFVYAGVDNLFDENYQESYGFPQAGRTAYAGVKFRF